MRDSIEHDDVESVIRLPEIISALSFALDLTEGAVPGHAIRSTVLGMRMASALRLPKPTQASLYYALQLKDVGCSSNAARMSSLFGGDDRDAKSLSKLTDWSGLFDVDPRDGLSFEKMAKWFRNLLVVPRDLRRVWRTVLPQAKPGERWKRLLMLSKDREPNTQELITIRCDRGASIMRKLEMSEMSCDSVHKLDEHWDGSGYPHGLAGERIPILARISAVAQTLDAFAKAYGSEAAVRTVQRRSGSWFDPKVVAVTLALERNGTLWTHCDPSCSVEESRQAAIDVSPHNSPSLRADQIDAICEAFAEVVDAKSPFTYRHSMGVTEAASALAAEMGFSAERQKLIKRVALLHDLGKLGISNMILDKPGRLTPEEREAVSAHPALSRQILQRISGFEELAKIAGEHHERLDGSGYPLGLKAEALSIESRVLMVADCFSALAEKRPYREALPLAKVMSILAEDVPAKLDAQVFSAMQSVAARWANDMPAVYLTSDPVSVCELPKTVSAPSAHRYDHRGQTSSVAELSVRA